MLTLGIDLAAQPKKTAMCELAWSDGVASVTSLSVGVTDDQILDAAESAGRVAIDVPFGWPVGFVESLLTHSRVVEAPGAWPDTIDLRWRATDRFVFERTGLRPLSVSTDKIGATALRWAQLERQLTNHLDIEVDRTGGGPLLEVYPAAALVLWGLPHSGYKGAKGRGRLASIVGLLEDVAPYLDLGAQRERLTRDDDAFDGLICSLVARAADIGLTESPVASVSHGPGEGWIHLPEKGCLPTLAFQ